MNEETQQPKERVSVTIVVDFGGYDRPAEVHVEGCPTEGLSEEALGIRVRLFGAALAGLKKEFGLKGTRK